MLNKLQKLTRYSRRLRKSQYAPQQTKKQISGGAELLEKGDIDPTAIPERTERPEPEPETSSRATLEARHRRDKANQKARRRSAIKRIRKIKKDAGLAYQQAQATARATVLGRARKQLTDEEIQTPHANST